MLRRDMICTDATEFSDARVVTFLNPYSFLKILESSVDLKKFDKICIDGVALTLFLRLAFRDSSIQRLSFDFTSVANLVFDNAVVNRETGFILGSDQDSNDKFLTKTAAMFPGILIAGRSGYFDNKEDQTRYLRSLASSEYEYIVIGMGAVKQEEAASALVDFGFTGRIYTCGGFIHQTALSGGEFYPFWVNKYNLRFAYRMFKEPSTVRRYVLDYPKSFLMLARNIQKFKC